MKKILVVLLFAFGTSFFNYCGAQYRDLHNFNGTNGGTPVGGSLTLIGTGLYGMTAYNAAHNFGCLFLLDTNGSGYKDLFDFNYTDGAEPNGTFTVSGKRLFGMTFAGARLLDGSIFSVDTNGRGYSNLHNFDLEFIGHAPYPQASLALSQGVLYGMTQQGGTNGDGNIFSVDTNGFSYTDIFDFNDTNGKSPYGAVIISGRVLYGMTSNGGTFGYGNIFSIKIDTNGMGIGYKDLLDFNGTNGASPSGSLIIAGRRLLGMTPNGGVSGNGNIFAIDTDGTRYKDLYDFSGTPSCSCPNGDLLLVGQRLYGVTENGGPYGVGTIFVIDTDGSRYMDLYDFNSANNNGAVPIGSLIYSGHTLYGMTSGGGSNGYGVIFSFDDISVGINELTGAKEAMNVYPNPNNGVFTLQANGQQLMANSHIEVDNVLGTKVYSQFSTLNSPLSINLSNQPNGVYLYRVITEDGNIVGEGKLIIQK